MRRRDAAFLALSLAAFALSIALGVWQLGRLEWKRDIIARMSERLTMEPVDIGEVERRLRAGDDVEFLKATARGRFIAGREVYLLSTLGGRVGWQVLAPFETEEGRALVIDRGFVPEGLKDPLSRPESSPDGPIDVTGVVRTHAGPKNLFAAEDRPEQGLFYSWSPEAMARSLGLAAPPGFVLHAGPGGPGVPVGRLPDPAAIANNHLQYAITWFGLAIVIVVMTALVVLRRRRA